MDTTLHAKMADVVINNLKAKYNFAIAEKEFKYGFIKPDLQLNMRLKPHTKDEMMEQVVFDIEKLIENHSILDDKDFFLNLGIIMHFLGDFFCAAHNNHFPGGILKHAWYEKNQNLFLRKYLVQLIKEAENIGIENFSSFADIKEFLLALHAQYLQEEICKKADLIYAFRIILTISYSLIQLRRRLGKVK